MAIWVTPPNILKKDDGINADAIVPFAINQTQNYPKGATIGELNYGADSTAFVFAFHEDGLPGEIPAFHNLIHIDAAERQTILDEWQTYDSTISEDNLLFARKNAPSSSISSSIDISYQTFFNDSITDVSTTTGLRLGSNGQLLGTLSVVDSRRVLLFKVQSVDLPEYASGVTYYSYSHVTYGSDIYKLKSGISTPHIASTIAPNTTAWSLVGTYTEQTAPIVRTFALVLNTRQSGNIGFTTLPDLGVIKAGQIIGESLNLTVEAVSASGEYITYSIDDEQKSSLDTLPDMVDGYYPCIPIGMDVTGDGTIIGRPGFPLDGSGVGKYRFIIKAHTTNGGVRSQEFELDVQAGFDNNNVRAEFRLSREHERTWFNMVSSEVLQELDLYRPTDPRYGIQRFPKMLLKDNLVGNLQKRFGTGGESITNIRTTASKYLSDNSISGIDLNMGNTKYITALDDDGEPLYDIIYKELTSANRDIDLSIDGTDRDQDKNYTIDGVKDTLVLVLGSNDQVFNDDPTDPRRFEVSPEDASTYFDSLPLWMTNPDTSDGAVATFNVALPIAYVLPGEGARFFQLGLEKNTLGLFLNTNVSFENIYLEYTLYPSRPVDVIHLGK